VNRRIVRLNAAARLVSACPPCRVRACTARSSSAAAAGPRRVAGLRTTVRPPLPFLDVQESGRRSSAPRTPSSPRRTESGAASVSRKPTPDGRRWRSFRDLRASRSLDDAKTSFVSAVSHELRTPLALIDATRRASSTWISKRGHHAAARRADRGRGAAPGGPHRRHHRRQPGRERRSRPAPDPGGRRRPPPRLPRGARRGARCAGRVADAPAVAAPRRRRRHAHPPGDRQPGQSREHAGRSATIENRARRWTSDGRRQGADDGRGIAHEDRDHASSASTAASGSASRASPAAASGSITCRRIVEAHGGWFRLDATTRGTSVSLGSPSPRWAPRPRG